MGVAASRLSSLRLRCVTIANARLQMLLPMMFMASSPGRKKSM